MMNDEDDDDEAVVGQCSYEQHMPTSCQHEQENRPDSKLPVRGRQGSCIAAGITGAVLEGVTSKHIPKALLAQSMLRKTCRVL